MHALAHRLQRQTIGRTRGVNADDFRIGVHGDEGIGPAFPIVIVCVMSVPLISLTLSVTIVPSCALASARPARCGANKPCSPITAARAEGCVNTGDAQPRPYLAVALAVEAKSGDLSADMFRQLRVRTCSDGTRTTRDRVTASRCENDKWQRARRSTRAQTRAETIMPSKRG